MFLVYWETAARKECDALPTAVREAVGNAIAKYLSHHPDLPQPPRLKRLHHFRPPLYRLRVGDSRVCYRLHGHCVVLLGILNRRDVDRWLARVKPSS